MTVWGHISQIARAVENLDRARQFWQGSLGLRELYAFPGLAFYDLGGTRLMLREVANRGPADILYLSVPDIAAAHADLTAKGLHFSAPPQRIHRHPDGSEEWMAVFKDDEDRDLALHAVIQAAPPQGA